jgi:uncharacterized membrane protein YhaH (DUF805 family)
MGVGHYLFGFSGRINRAKMWLFVLIEVVYAVVAVGAVLSAIGLDHIAAVAQHRETPEVFMRSPGLLPIFGIFGLMNLLLFFVSLAVTTKRLHDRNKSAWWLLVFVFLPLVLQIVRFASIIAAVHANGVAGAMNNPMGTLLGGIAFLIALWAFVELYCLRGTTGENQYGRDPLA